MANRAEYGALIFDLMNELNRNYLQGMKQGREAATREAAAGVAEALERFIDAADAAENIINRKIN